MTWRGFPAVIVVSKNLNIVLSCKLPTWGCVSMALNPQVWHAVPVSKQQPCFSARQSSSNVYLRKHQNV